MFALNPALPPAMPENTRAYAVGDIHGRADLLEQLIKLLEDDVSQAKTAENYLIFLGDYVDRGPGSRQVIQRLLEPFPGFTPVFLKGNHEAALLHFLKKPDVWRHISLYGAVETLLSYGVPFDPDQTVEAQAEALAGKFDRLLPPDHRRFLEQLAVSFTLGDYHFVHAGVRPGVHFQAQAETDLIRIREPFLSHGQRLEKIIVHGHTIHEEVEFHPHRIGIDTGAYATGRLTSLVLDGDRRRLIQT